ETIPVRRSRFKGPEARKKIAQGKASPRATPWVNCPRKFSSPGRAAEFCNRARRTRGGKGASCYNHQAARGDRLPLLPDRRRELGRGGPIYWIPPLPIPRPARSSRGEGEEDFRWS